MNPTDAGFESGGLGLEMFSFMEELYPICRSITGNGVRETLDRIGKRTPLQIFEVPTGTKVFDWEVPREWNIRDAYIKDPSGARIVDFKKSNLHVLNYSVPVSGQYDLESIRPHLFTIPEKPDWIPYRTSYYNENWGFCLSHNQLLKMEEGSYEVKIDSTLDQGSLTYGEVFIKGRSQEEILISTHICHPSLCNDNLSGIAVATYLAEQLRASEPYYSYRFIFIPGTIGAITWLAQNEQKLEKIRGGIVIALLGLEGKFTFKRTRSGNESIDRYVEHVLDSEGLEHEILDFIPYGYDERQFCSPGINLPVCNISRIPYGAYPEYHTSADNLELVSPSALEESYITLWKVIGYLEADRKYMNLFPKGEPQLGKRGLYDNVGGRNDSKEYQLALLWVLNFSDGGYSLSDISIRSGLPVKLIAEAADQLCGKGLLKSV